MANAGNVPGGKAGEIMKEAVAASKELSASSFRYESGVRVYEGISTPIKETRSSILDQAEEAKGRTLSERMAMGVMGWARAEKAFKHEVSFNALEEAVRNGLDGKTEKTDLTKGDVERVQKAVREWSSPHLVEGASPKGMDAAIAEKAFGFAPLTSPAIQSKGPSSVEAPLQQRSGAKR